MDINELPPQSIGERIIDEIIKQGMISISHPEVTGPFRAVWAANAAEQLDALVAQHKPRTVLNPGDAQYLVDAARAVELHLPDGHGFALFVLPIRSPKAAVRYISNCQRDGVAEALRQWIRRTAGGNYGKHL